MAEGSSVNDKPPSTVPGQPAVPLQAQQRQIATPATPQQSQPHQHHHQQFTNSQYPHNSPHPSHAQQSTMRSSGAGAHELNQFNQNMYPGTVSSVPSVTGMQTSNANYTPLHQPYIHQNYQYSGAYHSGGLDRNTHYSSSMSHPHYTGPPAPPYMTQQHGYPNTGPMAPRVYPQPTTGYAAPSQMTSVSQGHPPYSTTPTLASVQGQGVVNSNQYPAPPTPAVSTGIGSTTPSSDGSSSNSKSSGVGTSGASLAKKPPRPVLKNPKTGEVLSWDELAKNSTNENPVSAKSEIQTDNKDSNITSYSDINATNTNISTPATSNNEPPQAQPEVKGSITANEAGAEMKDSDEGAKKSFMKSVADRALNMPVQDQVDHASISAHVSESSKDCAIEEQDEPAKESVSIPPNNSAISQTEEKVVDCSNEKKEDVNEKVGNSSNEKEEIVNEKVKDCNNEKEESVNEKLEDCSNEKKDNVNEKEPEILKPDPNRYGPENPNGKKCYPIDFLVALCKFRFGFADPFPSTSSKWMSSGDTGAKSSSRSSSSMMPRQDMFSPHWDTSRNGQSASSGTGTHRPGEQPSRRVSQHAPSYMGRSSGTAVSADGGVRKVINSISLTQEVELKTASNPWKPSRAAKSGDGDKKALDTQQLLKKFRGMLNKLTPENFPSISEQVREMDITTEDRLMPAIGLIFDKALDEPAFCELYGKMCVLLKSIVPEGFSPALLKLCQSKFNSKIYDGIDIEAREKEIAEAPESEEKERLESELYEDKYKARMRHLGLMKFIGVLYKNDMLNDEIMYDCMKILLRESNNSEESMECLCDLIKTIGRKLESSILQSSSPSSTSQKVPPKNQQQKPAQQSKVKASYAAASQAQPSDAAQTAKHPTPQEFDNIFLTLRKVSKDPNRKLSNRIKYRILDTIELRDQLAWKPRQLGQANPKTLEEVRKEAENRRHAPPVARKSHDGSRPASGGSSISGQTSSSGGSLSTGARMGGMQSMTRPLETNDNKDRKLLLPGLSRAGEETKSLAPKHAWTINSYRSGQQTSSTTSSRSGPGFATALSNASTTKTSLSSRPPARTQSSTAATSTPTTPTPPASRT